ncbi:hypothetical protein [Pseudomonas sp. 9Ag]|uniref:hypothetical protein n=1 Tax=Pseudomonas sp. 9Ag TaxID=2653167 RepID=UPI0012F096DE|nr:hypothetical protein [Pseudomonas sp. 9Ag]VXC05419.1 conserved membrane hypothetical protein [Pseudomonas sp. 9Ag]
MKSFFLIVWALLSLTATGFVARELWIAPSWINALALLLPAYYSLCFFQLIRAAFRPWGLLGPRRRGGFWVCLLLLPLCLWPLRSAYEIWQAGAYGLRDDGDEARLMIVRPLLAWLQELVGYLGPMLVLVAAGVGMALLLLRLSRGQVVR